MKAAIVLESWKVITFIKYLENAGYKDIGTGAGQKPDQMLLFIEVQETQEELIKIAKTVKEAQQYCKDNRASILN
jgi:hypothetical protein